MQNQTETHFQLERNVSSLLKSNNQDKLKVSDSFLQFDNNKKLSER